MPSIYKHGEPPYVVVNIPDMTDTIFQYDPEASPLAALINKFHSVNQDYEDAKELIREVCGEQ